MKTITGRVFKFGDYVDVDSMGTGGRRPAKDYVMTKIRPNFPQEVKPGDVIIAGVNWGAGSAGGGEAVSRPLKELGVGAIVVDSVARLIYRSCISIGLPILICMGVSKMFNDGDQIELNIATGEIKNLTTGKNMSCKPLPEHLLQILEVGGIRQLFLEKAHQMGYI